MSQLATTIQNAMRLIKNGRLKSATSIIRRKLLEISGVHVATDETRTPMRATEPSTEIIEGRYVREPQPETGSWFRKASYTSPQGSRNYKVFMPAGAHHKPMPLVVMLHGCTQSPNDFALGTGMNELAAAQQCVIVYPEQPAAANGLKCWNWFKSSDQQRDRGEPAIIAGITRKVIAKYGIDANRVYVAGLSAGAAMAVVMGRTYPDLYAAVGVHSGIPYAAAHDAPSAFAAMKGTKVRTQDTAKSSPFVPTILLHGDSDKTVHPSNAETLARHFSASLETSEPTVAAGPETADGAGENAGSRHSYTRTLWHNINGKVVVEYWLVHGAGHAWFGGNPRATHTDPKGPDASREILRFFLAHKLSPIGN
jgi:poly(hydroxyalkanoate) depolymerase family esterase